MRYHNKWSLSLERIHNLGAFQMKRVLLACPFLHGPHIIFFILMSIGKPKIASFLEILDNSIRLRFQSHWCHKSVSSIMTLWQHGWAVETHSSCQCSSAIQNPFPSLVVDIAIILKIFTVRFSSQNWPRLNILVFRHSKNRTSWRRGSPSMSTIPLLSTKVHQQSSWYLLDLNQSS